MGRHDRLTTVAWKFADRKVNSTFDVRLLTRRSGFRALVVLFSYAIALEAAERRMEFLYNRDGRKDI